VVPLDRAPDLIEQCADDRVDVGDAEVRVVLGAELQRVARTLRCFGAPVARQALQGGADHDVARRGRHRLLAQAASQHIVVGGEQRDACVLAESPRG
jgi:hypothetical protein